MPCCGDSYEKQLMKNIKTKLKIQANAVKHEFKLLLLGTGESGKSTVLKAMQMIYGNKHEDDAYRQSFTVLVFQNLLWSLRLLYEAGKKLGVATSDAELDAKVVALVATKDEDFKGIDPATRATMAAFWADPAVQTMLAEHRERFYLPDSAGYFYTRLDAISAPGYVPSKDDILRVRKATTGIHEYVFDIRHKGIHFRMIDVGGQRSERKKWIHCFENVQSIIFIVSSSEYDMVLAEDGSSNRMQESLALFEHIVQYQWFRQTTFVLFLNKRDLLEKKIAEKPFTDTFPHFRRDPDSSRTEAQQCMDYIGRLYVEKADTETARGQAIKGADRVYVHHTCATDSDQIELLFEGVKIDIMKEALRTYNLIQ